MRQVTKYRAEDGTLWETAERAIHRDHLLLEIAAALEPLGAEPEDISNGNGYVQHVREAVLAAKRALLVLGKRETGHEVFNWPAEQVHNRSIVGRILDDSDIKPLGRAWWRIMCIDERDREWGQPFFAANPEKGEQREVPRP